MAELKEQPIRREHDSMDDFEHLEHVQDGQSNQIETNVEKVQSAVEPIMNAEDDLIIFSSNPSSSKPDDPKMATALLLESEQAKPVEECKFEVRSKEPESNLETQLEITNTEPILRKEEEKLEPETKEEGTKEIAKSVNHEPEIVSAGEKKPDDSWNVVEKPELVSEQPESVLEKPPSTSEKLQTISKEEKKVDSANEYLLSYTEKKERTSASETGDSEFESEVEASPLKSYKPVKQEAKRERVEDIEITSKERFPTIGFGKYLYVTVASTRIDI